MSSLKPYLIRAVYEWCVDQDLTPYLLVNARARDVLVPRHSIQEDGRIVLNLRPQAVHNLLLGDAQIEFNARFGGAPMQVKVPLTAVLAIYARENGQGMVFDGNEEDEPSPPPATPADTVESKPAKPRPVLKVVK
ncbi:MAG: ClpXP protease specificity-enhancing factor [Candidatus Methylumidiphilus sp.]